MPSFQSIRALLKKRAWLIVAATLLVVVTALVVVAMQNLNRLDQRIQTVFDGPKWSIPARVYSRPLELYQGLRISRFDVIEELNQLGYRRGDVNAPGQYTTSSQRLSLHTRGFVFADGREEAVNANIIWFGNSIDEITDDNGNAIPIIRLEPNLIGRVSPALSEDRLLVTIDQLPEGLIQALLAVEDPRFYDHFGLSIRGIARAMWVNLKERRFAQGGSTITQQLVKNLFLTRERTLKRKLTEWPMAVVLERRYSKDDILQAFVNEVFFAQDRSRAIHGFGLASHYFFDKPVTALQPHEYALLVGLLKGPSYYSPLRHPQSALKRRNLVLQIMHNAGELDDYQQWQQMPLGLSQRKDPSQQPAYLDLVRAQLTRDYSTDDLHKNGLSIFTNFDPLIQQALERSVEVALIQIQQEQSLTPEQTARLEVSAIITDSGTGEVVAVLGGKEARFAGFNRATDAKRPIGSLIKPLIYLTALQHPDRYNLLSVLKDDPVFLELEDGSIWAPNNFSGFAHGDVTLLEALTRSYNMAAVNTGLELGVEQIVATLQSLNPDKTVAPLPSLLLGAVDMNVVDVAEIYQSFASGGFATPLRTIREIQASDGNLLNRYPLRGNQLIDSRTMHLLNYALQTVMREGTGRRAYRYTPDSVSLAGKSGTSNEQRDSWFAGFGGDYAAVVWIGHDDNTPTPVTGSRGALEVWSRVMSQINRNALAFSTPPGVDYVPVDLQSGHRVDKDCPNAVELPFYRDFAPDFHLTDSLLDSACQ
ncbi:MAG: penicillin-binding protein 1B [Pseudomonadota bacterium]